MNRGPTVPGTDSEPQFAAQLIGATVDYPSNEGHVRALDEIDVDFPRSSSTAIVGRSGSGKSTLISVLSLLRRPTAGQVILDGRDTSNLPDSELARFRSAAIGVVFQSFHLEASLTAADNVMLSWFFRGGSGSRHRARRRAKDLLDQLGIGDLAQRQPNAMSGGQRQRVAIARALFSEPALFVADEPTGNLDEDTANAVAETIFGLPALVGATVVVVTHDPTVASMAGRTLELARGTLSAAAATGGVAP